jgi:hypothetical protein
VTLCTNLTGQTAMKPTGLTHVFTLYKTGWPHGLCPSMLFKSLHCCGITPPLLLRMQACTKGSHHNRLKKVTSIRPRKTLTLEYYGSPSKRKAAFGAGDEFGVSKRKRLVANKMMLGNDNMRENRLAGNHGLPPQRVLPDIAVKKLSSGIHEGKAGAFAARKFGCGEVVACYAGKLALSSNVRRQAAAVLMQERVAKWPPDRNHPLIESVLATNYEWGPLKSRWLNSAIEQLYGDEDAEKLVIMPYPNYGNQTMAVNQCETAKQQNCIYIQANYKGFPYIFLVAFTEILRGEQVHALTLRGCLALDAHKSPG